MKTKNIIAILTFILISVPVISNLSAKNINSKTNTTKVEYKISEEKILRAKFSSSSVLPAYLIIKLKNKKTQKNMDIVCSNNEWFEFCKDSLKLIKNRKDYVEYMTVNYDKVFDISDELYKKMEKYEASNFYTNKYKTKEELQKGMNSGDFAKNTEQQLLKDRSFIKMMVQFVPVLLVNPEDGTIQEDTSHKNQYVKKEKKITKETLKKRFSDFSTSPIFVLIKIKNSETKEEAEITCANETWANICVKKLKLVNHKGYTDYMVKNYNKVFDVEPKIYDNLKKSTNYSLIEPLKYDQIIRINCLDGSIMYQ